MSKFLLKSVQIFDKSNSKKSAYTLAEVVIVLLVVAVVVSVSIRITKNKFSKIRTLTYYSASSILRTINDEIIRNNEAPEVSEDSEDVDNSENSEDDPTTISRTGAEYCAAFVSYANTAPSLITGGEECQGDAVNSIDENTDFSTLKEDVALKNGIRIYNMSQNPQRIGELNNNSKGSTYVSGANTIDIDEWGYVLYLDIDNKSSRGGKLWEDVFPFFVTLSGNVIPAYNASSSGQYGGDSRQFLQTSVSDEYSDANGRHVEWVTKSASFKESACKMGILNAATPYCSTAPAVGLSSSCANSEHDCRLNYVTPTRSY
jgi:hypothetical protein